MAEAPPRRAPAPFALALLLVPALPALVAAPAAATHFLLAEAGLDEEVMRTREDDAAVLREPGHPLDGVANRVTPPGERVGDGALFLDSRLAQTVGAHVGDSRTGVLVFAGAAIGRHDLLFPGTQRLFAWYGWWSDFDGDRLIRDVHDARAGGGGGGAGADEFKWRGRATNENLAIVSTRVPESDPPADRTAMTPSHFVRLVDETALNGTEQAWLGNVEQETASGFLATIQTYTLAAGARAAPGSALGLDLDDPAALVDVDRYESVNPDVEALYADARATDVIPLVAPAIEAFNTLFIAAREAAAPVVEIVDGLVDGAPSLDFVQEAAGDVLELAWQPERLNPSRIIKGGYGKEPTTSGDDYGGRALFDGAPDLAGAGNEYPGYADHHFYADATPDSGARRCIGFAAPWPAPPLPAACLYLLGLDLDPLGGRAGPRAAWSYLAFTAVLDLWKDANGDTHLGEVCDESGFDANANSCRADLQPWPWPHYRGAGETVDVCAVAEGRGRTFVASPLGDVWAEGSFLVRDALVVDGTLSGQVVKLGGATPVVLRWSDNCVNEVLYSRDALVLPPSSFGVETRAEFAIPGYKDVALGIDVGRETVTDVDVYPAAM